jgi:NAD(P)-dependent dehydrogenase (short-subunit alcohol dehydrogenase family)
LMGTLDSNHGARVGRHRRHGWQHTQRAVLAVLALSTLPALPGPTLAAQDARIAPDGRAVLITGATSGIGRLTTELLAERGFFVYAGARSDADMASLSALDGVQAVRLDVTIPEQIEAAVETVRAGGRGLYGLINNAGVGTLGPVAEVRDEDLAFDLDVNVWGPVRVTRAFAPLLVASGGRIATTTSIAGLMPYPFSSPYVISKYAAEGFVDQLAAEMASLGVAVAAIEPGAYDSRIGEGMGTRLREAGYGAPGSLYEGRFEGWAESVADRSALEEPHEVAEAFYDFLTVAEPRRRWMVVPGQNEAERTLSALLQRVAELNQGDHAYSRDELVRMLDEALATVGASR